MSRWVFRLGVGIALVALAFAGAEQILALRPGVTEANARRIRMGMSLEQVERLLGGRATNEQYLPPICCMPVEGIIKPSFRRQWILPSGTVSVFFGIRGTVTQVHFQRTAPEPLLSQLRSWLGL
jgi:hypothetical protein